MGTFCHFAKILGHKWPKAARVDSGLAVAADPAAVASKYGTREDLLIGSALLNCTVSGLISRTVLNRNIIGPNDYHGAAFYPDLRKEDLTYHFIDAVESAFPLRTAEIERICMSNKDEIQEMRSGLEIVQAVKQTYGIRNIHLIKPGIGETTRVLLRRVPWKILVYSLDDRSRLGHIYQLAQEKSVPVEVYPLKPYFACGLIREISDT